MRLLVTGGCGFIGSNFLKFSLNRSRDIEIINLDALTYAGNPANTETLESEHKARYAFVQGDISDPATVETTFRDYGPFDAVINFAAESHVDRSIQDPLAFVRTNITGTALLLDAARRHKTKRFLQVSTDEVYGSLGPLGKFTETSPLAPSSPYSASKAGADLLVLAAHRTHGQEVVVTRCTNNYGPFQHPEKLIPTMILTALDEKPLPIYGDGKNVRDWIHVTDHCRSIWHALERAKSGEVFNIGSENEIPNIIVVKTILKLLGKSEKLISYVTDRPGHDRRYAVDAAKARWELSWHPQTSWEDGLKSTVEWYQANEAWWAPLRKVEG